MCVTGLLKVSLESYQHTKSNLKKNSDFVFKLCIINLNKV